MVYQAYVRKKNSTDEFVPVTFCGYNFFDYTKEYLEAKVREMERYFPNNEYIVKEENL